MYSSGSNPPAFDDDDMARGRVAMGLDPSPMRGRGMNDPPDVRIPGGGARERVVVRDAAFEPRTPPMADDVDDLLLTSIAFVLVFDDPPPAVPPFLFRLSSMSFPPSGVLGQSTSNMSLMIEFDGEFSLLSESTIL